MFIELPKLNYMGPSLKIASMKAVKKSTCITLLSCLSISGVIHIFDGLISLYIGTYMVIRFGFESYWLSGRFSCIWIGGYMLLIGVSNVVAIKIALRR